MFGILYTYLVRGLAHSLAVLTRRFWDVIGLLALLTIAAIVVL